MSTPYLVLAAILLTLFAIGLYLVVAVVLDAKRDRENRRESETRADNARLEAEIIAALEQCQTVVRGWFA